MEIAGIGVVLIVLGLLIAFLSPQAGRMAALFWWVGIILAAIGLIFLITPVLIWVDSQLRAMIGRR